MKTIEILKTEKEILEQISRFEKELKKIIRLSDKNKITYNDSRNLSKPIEEKIALLKWVLNIPWQ